MAFNEYLTRFPDGHQHILRTALVTPMRVRRTRIDETFAIHHFVILKMQMPIDDDIRVGVLFGKLTLKELMVMNAEGQKEMHIIPKPVPHADMPMRQDNF